MIAKKIFATVFLLLLIFFPINEKSNAKYISSVITVDDEGDGDFTSIQQAVNHAKDGDIILVYSGIYNEEVIISDKSITIEGVAHELGKGNDTGKPVITVEKDTKYGIFIPSNNCTIKNMKIIGKDGYGWAGIGFWKANYNKIINNDISKMEYWGIEVVGNYNYISGNNVSDCKGAIQIGGGYGNIVSSNNILDAKRGIQICGDNITIIRNVVKNCGPGIFLYGARFSRVMENNISLNGCGINVMNSRFIVITHNNIIQNKRQGSAADAFFCLWYGNYWDDWHIPLPKPIPAYIWIFPWIQFDWHPLMQPYEWWKE